MLWSTRWSTARHAQSVRVELEAALCASLVGREMARLSAYQGAEEASYRRAVQEHRPAGDRLAGA